MPEKQKPTRRRRDLSSPLELTQLEGDRVWVSVNMELPYGVALAIMKLIAEHQAGEDARKAP
jgi:hypothetical protein